MAEAAEQRTEAGIQVRQVTSYQTSWAEEERGAPGAFTFQLVLDNGAEEYVIRPTAEDAEVLTRLLGGNGAIYFDLTRKVLIFGNVSLGG